ncbi:MAG: hypothetical protein JXR49_06970 [Acidobacteria bacterium]|nr:hypothetical protein [Acidobacteriota bacterium]
MKRLLIPFVFLCCLGCQQSKEIASEDVGMDVQTIRDRVAELEASTNSTHPIIGSWKLNIEKSTFAPNSPPPPKEETEVYRETEGNLIELTYKSIKMDGSTQLMVFTWPAQGGAVNIVKADIPENLSWVQTFIEGEWYATLMVDGKQFYTRHKTISRDGKILRQSFRSTDDQGKPYENILIFDRQ